MKRAPAKCGGFFCSKVVVIFSRIIYPGGDLPTERLDFYYQQKGDEQMFDITFTAEQVQELEVLVRARIEKIEEVRAEYGYQHHYDEFITLRAIQYGLLEVVNNS